MVPTTFLEVPEISRAQAVLNATLTFDREKLQTEVTHKGPGLDSVLFTRPDGKPVNRPIKTDRIVLNYPDVVNYVSDELDKSGLKWKFKTATLIKNGEFYAEVLFDLAVPDPDGNPLSALGLFRSNLVGNPLTAKFGTYRYVCMNGATVGQTISDIVVRPKMASELLKTSLQDQFMRALGAFDKVGLKYKSLLDIPLSSSLKDFMEDENIVFGLKKMALTNLEKEGVISVVKMKRSELKEDPASAYTLLKQDGTKWTLYNALTNAATWETDNFASRTRQYGLISEVMGV